MATSLGLMVAALTRIYLWWAIKRLNLTSRVRKLLEKDSCKRARGLYRRKDHVSEPIETCTTCRNTILSSSIGSTIRLWLTLEGLWCVPSAAPWLSIEACQSNARTPTTVLGGSGLARIMATADYFLWPRLVSVRWLCQHLRFNNSRKTIPSQGMTYLTIGLLATTHLWNLSSAKDQLLLKIAVKDSSRLNAWPRKLHR